MNPIYAGTRKHFRPHVRGFKWYEERVAGVISVRQAALPGALDAIRRNHPRFTSATDDEIRAAAFTEDDARLVLAREHGFETWDAFKSHVEAIQSGSRFEPFTAAFDAVQSGDVAAVAALLRDHPDLLDARGTNGSSLLNLAVSMRQPAVCRLLIDGGAEVDLATTRGVTPLHQAAYSNQPDIIELLIAAGASPRANAYGEGGTPLLMALFWGHDRARETLARHAIVPNNLRVAAGAGRLDLTQASFNTDGSLTAEAIAHRGFYRPHTGFPIWSPTDARQEVLDEALAYASRNGQAGVLELLISRGADINSDPYRGTALAWAVFNKHLDVICWLLDHGADVNRQATFGGPCHGKGYTALHAAVDAGRIDIAKILIERGADPNIADELYKATPAGWAEYRNLPQIRDYLREVKPG